MVDTALDTMTVPARDELIDKYRRDYRVRVPDADPADPQIDTDARVFSDQVLPLYARIKILAEGIGFKDATGNRVLAWGEREGIEGPRGAVGASGFVNVVASVGGTITVTGEELTYEPTGFVYTVVSGASVQNGASVRIVGKTVGPGSDLPAGATLKWATGRPGRGLTAPVEQQRDGRGLSGGQNDETIDAYKARIHRARTHRAASGNENEYIALLEETPGLGVQKAFAYPGIRGTGTIGLCFTIFPATSGGTRAPNAAQVAQAQAYVVSKMPADDGAFFCLLTETNADIAVRVTWDPDALGWYDLNPWPLYSVSPAVPVTVVSAASPTSFVLRHNPGGRYPVPGNNICFFDATSLSFKKKRILTAALNGGATQWTIVCDTTLSASDETYTPAVGQRAMPWSESLELLKPRLFSYLDTLGPGEQTLFRYDEGRRMRRQPTAPKYWPSTPTDRGLGDSFEIPQVLNAKILEKPTLEGVAGSPGGFSPILKLRWLSVFPAERDIFHNASD